MIRVLQRKLIIPRGDTGTFSVPALAVGNSSDVAVFTIFDDVTKTRLLQKVVAAENEQITITFTHNDTVNLKPGSYLWDIRFYNNPVFAEGKIIDGEEINSYYAGYTLPTCEVRETGEDMLVSPSEEAISPAQLDIFSAALASLPPFPTAPTTDGIYILQATVTNGVAHYSWAEVNTND